MKYNHILIAFVVAAKIIAAIVIEVKLPNKNKTLRFNLNCRRNIYTIGWLIDCLFFAILLKSMQESHSRISNSNYYFAVLIAIAIGLFVALYLTDKKTVTKYRIYVTDNINEYHEYKNKDIGGIQWTSFRSAGMTTLFAMLPISVLLS